MPIVATAAADWNEGDETTRLVASIEHVVRMRFGRSSLVRDVRHIADPIRLREILDFVLSATNLADIESAILSAVPPPK